MSGKMYENEESLANESAFRSLYEKYYCNTLEKMPIRYQIDFSVLEGKRGPFKPFKVCGFIEFKQRSNARRKYKTVIIPLGKLQASKRLYEDTGKDTLLWIQWTDTSAWCRLNTVDFDLRWQGVSRRNDDRDKEPVIHIPIGAFTRSKWEPSKF